MRNLKIFTAITVLALTLNSCLDSDDDSTPDSINEEEVITTVELTLTPDAGGDTIVLQSIDADGEGGDDPVVTVSGSLTSETTYSGAIVFLNETESPAEDVTVEVEEEGEEHQVFYTASSDLTTSVTYNDTDNSGNPLGLDVTLTTGTASSGTLTVTLRHEPEKPNDGTLTDAGGETDATVTFPVEIED